MVHVPVINSNEPFSQGQTKNKLNALFEGRNSPFNPVKFSPIDLVLVGADVIAYLANKPKPPGLPSLSGLGPFADQTTW